MTELDQKAKQKAKQKVQNITCISCPVGCRMEVTTLGDKVIDIKGNACKRGAVYAQQESIAPRRMVTAVLPVTGRQMPLSIKTKEPIPKDKIQACMAALSDITIKPPIALGQAIVKNICDTGIDVIATKNIE